MENADADYEPRHSTDFRTHFKIMIGWLVSCEIGFYRKQRQFWNPVTPRVKFKSLSQNLGLDPHFSDPSHKSDFKTVFPWPPGTPMTSHKLCNAFCGTWNWQKVLYLARDNGWDHDFESCSEIRHMTRIRKMWVPSQILRQWLEIRPLQGSKTASAFCKTRLPNFSTSYQRCEAYPIYLVHPQFTKS